MKPEILEYLKSQRVGVIAVEMLDGSPHGATVHFGHAENPLTFIFKTNREYRKCEPLFGRKNSRATFVVGFEEGKQTFQLDGEASLILDNEKDLIETYLQKFPEKREVPPNPDKVFFKFIPTWWRFTDWSGPEGKKIVTSND